MRHGRGVTWAAFKHEAQSPPAAGIADHFKIQGAIRNAAVHGLCH